MEDFLYAGSSSLLLSFLNLQFPFSPIYLVALIPYFYRLTQVGTVRSIFLGLTLATSFVMVVFADNLVLAPANLAIQLVFYNIVFVSYGVAVVRARDIFGINPLLLFFLWLPLEYCFRNFEFSSQFYALTSLESGSGRKILNPAPSPADPPGADPAEPTAAAGCEVCGQVGVRGRETLGGQDSKEILRRITIHPHQKLVLFSRFAVSAKPSNRN